MIIGALLRAVAVVAAIAGYIVVLDNSDSTDPLSAGLLAFLILVTIAFVWALVDGIRVGLVAALVRWLVASALAGVGIPAVLAIRDSVGFDLEDALFFGLLLFVPALVGLVIGAVVHQARGGDEVTA